MTRKHSNNRVKEKPNNFELKYGNQENIFKKAKWKSNMTKELKGLEEGPKAEMHIDLFKTTLKKYQIGKRQAMMEYMDLVQEIHLHSRQTTNKNEQMPTKSTRTRMDDQRKDHIDPEVLPQRKHLKQLQTHNTTTHDEENINSKIREEIYYSLTSCGLFPEEQKGWRKGSRGTGDLLYIDQHILNESKTRRKNIAMAGIDS